MIVLAIYVALFIGAWAAVRAWRRRRDAGRHDFTSLKTVTFGDESAVTPDRAASVISLLAVFLIWGAFTGSKLVPLHVPGPFVGDTSFTYTATDGTTTDDATVTINVVPTGETVPAPEAAASEGTAQDDAAAVAAWRSVLIKPAANDTPADPAAWTITAHRRQAGHTRPVHPGRQRQGRADCQGIAELPARQGVPDGADLDALARGCRRAVHGDCAERLSEHVALGTSWIVAVARAGRVLPRVPSSAFRLVMRWVCRTGSGAGSTPSSNSCARSRRLR